MELLKQPEALRLAELLERGPCRSGDSAIAAELRRLHKVNVELLTALKPFVAGYEHWTDGDFALAKTSLYYPSADKVRTAMSAIAKAEAA